MAPTASKSKRGCSLAVRWAVGAGALLLACVPAPALAQTEPRSLPRVRVAAVGGLVLSGVWPLLAKQAGQALGLQVDTVAASPKEGVVPVFERGDAEVLLVHASDEALGLQASGHAAPVRVWAWNGHVLVGPTADPALASVRSASASTALSTLPPAGTAALVPSPATIPFKATAP